MNPRDFRVGLMRDALRDYKNVEVKESELVEVGKAYLVDLEKIFPPKIKMTSLGEQA